MSKPSSRILRAEELAVVSPISWDHAVPLSISSTKPPRDQENPGKRPLREPLAAVEREREQTEQAAYQRGFSEGKGVGREQTAAELKPVLDRIAQSIAELSGLRSRIRKDTEGELLRLAIAIARRVLHRELTLDPESIRGLIKVAIERLEPGELSRVRVHPDLEAAVRAALERFSNQKVEVTPDPALQCGDVLFETAHGTLDGSIESQLREITRGLADRLRK
jgi:flagellar assembly protein FliH